MFLPMSWTSPFTVASSTVPALDAAPSSPSASMNGREVGDRLLHDAGRLDDLREEHLASAEQVADGVHPAHQRPLDDVDGAVGSGARFFDVVLDEHGDAVDQRVVDATRDAPRPPLGGRGIDGLGTVTGEPGGRLEQPLGGVGATGEDDVLAQLAQFGVDLVVHRELAGVDDAHAHPRLDRLEQEHRVHRFTHRLVAPERERQVRHTAGDVDVREFVGDLLRRLDEVEPVAVVLLDTGGDREDVGVDDDVLGREPDLVDQQVVGAPGDVDLAFDRVGLADLVEGHHDDGRAVVETRAGLGEECLLALLHRDRVHDRLALHALQTGLDHLELRGVDHDRHAGDVGLGRDQVEERRHRLHAVDQAVVHVDVDDLRATLDLLERDHERLAVLVVLDQSPELRRTGDVGALADIDERDVVGERERLEARQLQTGRARGHDAGRLALDGDGNGTDVSRRGAAAAAHDVDEPGVGELADERRRLLGCLVVATQFVRQAGVGIRAHQGVGDGGQLEQVRAHLLRPERAVQPDRQRLRVADRLPERGGRLARQRAAGTVGDRAGDHQRQLRAVRAHRSTAGHDRRLGVQRVEDRLEEDRIDSPAQQRLDLFLVGVGERPERDRPVARILHLRRQRQRHVGRADGAGHEAPAPVATLRLLGGLARQAGGDLVELGDLVDGVVVGLRDAVGRERVRLDDVRAREQVAQVDVSHRVRLGEREQLAVAGEVAAVIAEPVAAERLVGQPERLDLGAHRAVEHDDALAGELCDGVIVEGVVVHGHATSLVAWSSMA